MPKILLKRNSISGVIPRLDEIESGELVYNIADGILYAKKLVNSVESIVNFTKSELEKVDEGGKTGWVLSGDDRDLKLDIGQYAIDLTMSDGLAGTKTDYFGAAGNYSTSFGFNTIALGADSIAIGRQNTSGGHHSFTSGVGNITGEAVQIQAVDLNTKTLTLRDKDNIILEPDDTIEIFGISNFNAESPEFFIENNQVDSYDDTTGDLILKDDIINTSGVLLYIINTDRVDSSKAISSLASGFSNTITKNYGVAFGYRNAVTGVNSIAVGFESSAVEENTVAMGYRTRAEAKGSFAVGSMAKAQGIKSLALGSNVISEGDYSQSFGNYSIASGLCSHAEGYSTESAGDYSHTEGRGTFAPNNYMTACGLYNTGVSGTLFEIGNGIDENQTKNALEVYQDGKVIAPSLTTTLIDDVNTDNKVLITKEYADNTYGGGTGTQSELERITENGKTGWALLGDDRTYKADIGSHALDFSVVDPAVGSGSYGASGSYSTAEGSQTTASNSYTHAEGYKTTASGVASHAEGYNTVASGDYTHADGYGTIAPNKAMHACGSFNTGETNTIFEVGIGIDDLNRNNALEIDTDGVIVAPQLSTVEIDNAPSRVIITKEWIQASGNLGISRYTEDFDSGDNQTEFTVSRSFNSGQENVYVNGVIQKPNRYSIAAGQNDTTIITFNNGLSEFDWVRIEYFI
jgi:hypothetical protein